jgi:hypothetical protein
LVTPCSLEWRYALTLYHDYPLLAMVYVKVGVSQVQYACAIF